MKFNKILHAILALLWVYTLYLLINNQGMNAMYLMSIGMLVESVYCLFSKN
ncbi:hypothetical protein [Convivina intestini]|uniref:Uncharacterized protein n=1 Tax=Convivina intestini TaxID=1505726 RepID=A0A2U1D9E1_9LACO|nr:hypothetical protein [Convivina intestini]PVY84293.1 hypothetical protein C7384_10437 [Convivina intestini]CAH1855424.1 hypothetical protein R077811_01055 [Convivina intestini]SDB93968.1 hypothetical protein SAMN05216341_10636 [Leuconostocaceae bacterium R-53105]